MTAQGASVLARKHFTARHAAIETRCEFGLSQRSVLPALKEDVFAAAQTLAFDSRHTPLARAGMTAQSAGMATLLKLQNAHRKINR
jgi:hypothetical protein